MVVYFGTGAYMTGDDIETTDDESFYCVFDDHDGITSNRFDLVDQTSHPTDIGAADGWYVDLVNAQGERVTEKALVVARTVYFTSFAPVSDICQAGGSSWFYTMAYDDGMPVENEEGEEVARSHELGDGVASRPVVDIVNERVIVQSSDATINVEEITATFFYLNVRSWQESYSFVEEPPAEP